MMSMDPSSAHVSATRRARWKSSLARMRAQFGQERSPQRITPASPAVPSAASTTSACRSCAKSQRHDDMRVCGTTFRAVSSRRCDCRRDSSLLGAAGPARKTVLLPSEGSFAWLGLALLPASVVCCCGTASWFRRLSVGAGPGYAVGPVILAKATRQGGLCFCAGGMGAGLSLRRPYLMLSATALERMYARALTPVNPGAKRLPWGVSTPPRPVQSGRRRASTPGDETPLRLGKATPEDLRPPASTRVGGLCPPHPLVF